MNDEITQLNLSPSRTKWICPKCGGTGDKWNGLEGRYTVCICKVVQDSYKELGIELKSEYDVECATKTTNADDRTD